MHCVTPCSRIRIRSGRRESRLQQARVHRGADTCVSMDCMACISRTLNKEIRHRVHGSVSAPADIHIMRTLRVPHRNSVCELKWLACLKSVRQNTMAGAGDWRNEEKFPYPLISTDLPILHTFTFRSPCEVSGGPPRAIVLRPRGLSPTAPHRLGCRPRGICCKHKAPLLLWLDCLCSLRRANGPSSEENNGRKPRWLQER
jgi:hypothetical protein